MTRPAARVAREVALTCGAMLGVACILLTVAGAVFGIQPLVFRSGSMSPTIHTGDLAVSRTVDAGSLRSGDIVSVVNGAGNRLTHRVVETSQSGDAVQLTLKGDANRGVDAEAYTVTEAEKVLFAIPKAGYVVDAAASRAGLFVLGAYVLGMLVLALRGRPPGGPDLPVRRHRGGARRAPRSTAGARKMAGAAFVGGLVLIASPASAAPWTDDVAITGASATSSTLPPPTLTCGAVGVLSVTFSWTAVPGATSYTLHFGTNGSSTETLTATTKTLVAAISGGRAWVVANRAFGSTTWSSVPSATRTYTVAVVGLCS